MRSADQKPLALGSGYALALMLALILPLGLLAAHWSDRQARATWLASTEAQHAGERCDWVVSQMWPGATPTRAPVSFSEGEPPFSGGMWVTRSYQPEADGVDARRCFVDLRDGSLRTVEHRRRGTWEPAIGWTD